MGRFARSSCSTETATSSGPAGCTPSCEALREFCRGKLPAWSIPDRVVIADSIPHGATGKILKAELRRIHTAGDSLDNLRGIRIDFAATILARAAEALAT